MAKRVLISDADKVFSPAKGQSQTQGRSLEPTSSPEGMSPSQPTPAPTQPQAPPVPKKPKPGRRTLSDEERLSDDFIDNIENQVKNATQGKAQWNVGGLPTRPGEMTGPASDSNINIGDILEPDQIPGGDSRIWVDPDQLDKEIDSANRQGEENERVQDAEDAKKEERTDSEKTSGGKGKGRGRVRDRIAIEKLSQTDWASIFKTRLAAYSTENAKYLPWNRRFMSSKTLRPRLGSKTPEKDVLPELNLVIDTSSSLSYREMAVILGEIDTAMESAKIKNLNVFMWHHQPYAYKSWTNISSKNFNEVIEWIQTNWQGGGNDETLLYEEIVKKGKAKKFTISLTDAYLDNHMTDGELKVAWTKALDPSNTIFAIIYPNRSITYDSWLTLANRMPGQKIPVFLDTRKFR